MVVRVKQRSDDVLVYATQVQGSSYFENVIDSRTLNEYGSAKFKLGGQRTVVMLNLILQSEQSSATLELYTIG
jgi:hypothetical protein